MKTPSNWIAEKDQSFSDDSISQILLQCKNDSKGESSYKIGDFKFKDRKYPQDFGLWGIFRPDLSSGAIMEFSISCISDLAKNKISDYAEGNLEIANKKALEEFLNLPGFGDTKFISFLNNNLQFKIGEYIYVSPSDAGKNDTVIREKYSEMFDKIISSFKFVK